MTSAKSLHGARRATSAIKKYPPVTAQGAETRIRVVSEIFSTVHQRYDFMNRLMSARRDVAWRRSAVRRMRFHTTLSFLDVACGTADLSIEAARAHPEIIVVGADFSPRMLEVGMRKILRKGLESRVSLREADATALPFPDGSFDVTAIAFGMRNIPDIGRALEEMTRVTAPGGQVMVLEMTFAPAPLFKGFYHAYLTHVMPLLARPFAANTAAYSYLPDSIFHFPTPPALASMMQKAGLREVRYHALSHGIAYLHIGRKQWN